jgi:hypothetical protein
LIEDIRLGEKIFVYSSADFTDPLDGLRLIDGFRGAGGCGPLLIVSVGREECVDRIDHNTFGAVMPKLTWWNGAVHLDQAAWERALLAFGDALAKTGASWSNLLR